MPKFELNAPPSPKEMYLARSWGYISGPRNVHPYWSLDDFTQGYVEAMFFTNGDTGDDNPDRLNDMGVVRLTHRATRGIAADCARFLAARADDGRTMREIIDAEPGDDGQAGADFWFTRQGHGVGFWSRDESVWSLDAQGALSDAARAMGEAYVDVARGWIHYR